MRGFFRTDPSDPDDPGLSVSIVALPDPEQF